MKTEVLLLPVVYFPLEFMIFCCERRKYANIFIPIHAYVHHVLLVTCSPTAPLPFHGMGSVVGIEREEEVTAECNGSAKGAPLACIYIYIYIQISSLRWDCRTSRFSCRANRCWPMQSEWPQFC